MPEAEVTESKVYPGALIFPLALKSVSITYFMCAHEPIYYKRMEQNTLNMHQINHKEN